MNTYDLQTRLTHVNERRHALPSLEDAAASLILAGKPITADVLLAADLLDLEARALERLVAASVRADFLAEASAFVATAVADADALLANPPDKTYEDRQRIDKVRERVHMAAMKIGAASKSGERVPTPHAFVDVLNRVSALSLLMADPATVNPKEG